MSNISERQQQLLSAIINEFVETAQAVGSLNLIDNKKYNFKISSATIRNEMAELVIHGYLYKKHSSAGRIPTTKAWRFFVDEVRKQINYIDSDEKISVGTDLQDEMMNSLTKVRDEKTELIRQGLNFLSMLSENAAVALIGSNLYYSGLSNLTNLPEMQDHENLKKILELLEDYYSLSDIFNKNKSETGVHILIGEEETGNEKFRDYSIIFAELRFKNGERGFVAVIGPNRMKYKQVISSVKYISDTIKHLVNN